MELASIQEGCSILSASSFDVRHPGSNILEGDKTCFWSTTGGYPQEVIVQLGSASNIQLIETTTTNARKMTCEACTGHSPTSWERLYSVELEDSDGQLQTDSHRIGSSSDSDSDSYTFLKFTLCSGHSEISTFNSLSIRSR